MVTLCRVICESSVMVMTHSAKDNNYKPFQELFTIMQWFLIVEIGLVIVVCFLLHLNSESTDMMIKSNRVVLDVDAAVVKQRFVYAGCSLCTTFVICTIDLVYFKIYIPGNVIQVMIQVLCTEAFVQLYNNMHVECDDGPCVSFEGRDDDDSYTRTWGPDSSHLMCVTNMLALILCILVLIIGIYTMIEILKSNKESSPPPSIHTIENAGQIPRPLSPPPVYDVAPPAYEEICS